MLVEAKTFEKKFLGQIKDKFMKFQNEVFIGLQKLKEGMVFDQYYISKLKFYA